MGICEERERLTPPFTMLLRSPAVNYLRIARWGALVTFAILFYMLNASYIRQHPTLGARPLPLSKYARPRSRIELQPPEKAYIDAVTAARDENGVVVVMSANSGYLPMVLNTECSMRRVGIKRALLIALDRKVYEWASKRPFFAPVLHSSVGEARNRPRLVEYGKAGFPDLTMQKFSSAERVLATGASVLFTDGDVFYCSNPIPEIVGFANRHRDRPILFQTSWAKEDLGDFINSGFFFARPTEDVRRLLLQVPLDHKVNPVAHDQRGINNRLCRRVTGGLVVYEGPSQILKIARGRPMYCMRDGLRAGFLDWKRFPNQKRQIHQLLDRSSRKDLMKKCEAGDVAILHNNWMQGKGKELRFRRKGLWYAAADNETCLEQAAAAPAT